MSADAEDIELITSSAEKVLSRDFDLSFIRSFQESGQTDKQQLVALCQEMGWQGLLIAEEDGGFGFGLQALCALLEELGKAAFPSLYFSHFVTPVVLLNRVAKTANVSALLSAIAEGEKIPCLVADSSTHSSFVADSSFTLSSNAEQPTLNGKATFIGDLDSANIFLVPASEDDGTISLIGLSPDDQSLRLESQYDKSFGNTFSLFVDNAVVNNEALLCRDVKTALLQTFSLCAVAKSAEMIGCSQRAMDFAIEHIMIRKQFGKLLAEFQAVQHQAADMYKMVDVARLFVAESIEQHNQDSDVSRMSAYCKSWTNDACFQTCATSHQLMGGTGYMLETDLQLLSSQGLRNQYEFGSSDYLRDTIGQQLECVEKN